MSRVLASLKRDEFSTSHSNDSGRNNRIFLKRVSIDFINTVRKLGQRLACHEHVVVAAMPCGMSKLIYE